MKSSSKKRLMTIGVPSLVEAKRGCGYRKPGGYYLRSDGLMMPCGKLPKRLGVCPTCGEGIRFSMAPRWVNAAKLFEDKVCSHRGCDKYCPLSDKNIVQLGECLLIWIGEKFYPTTDKFVKEACSMGVSRRVKAVPRGMDIGKTTVLVAHLKGETINTGPTTKPEYYPAIFHAFQPQRIEYVCKGDESDEEIDQLRKRGLTPVIVEREETMDAFEEEDDEE